MSQKCTIKGKSKKIKGEILESKMGKHKVQLEEKGKIKTDWYETNEIKRIW